MMNTNTNITLGTGDSFVMPKTWFVYANVDLVDMEAYAIAKFHYRVLILNVTNSRMILQMKMPQKNGNKMWLMGKKCLMRYYIIYK